MGLVLRHPCRTGAGTESCCVPAVSHSSSLHAIPPTPAPSDEGCVEKEGASPAPSPMAFCPPAPGSQSCLRPILLQCLIWRIVSSVC